MLYHYGLWWTHTLTKWCTSTYHQSAINPMENPSLNKQPGFGRSLWDSRGRCLWSAVKQWGSLPVVPVDPIWVFDNDLGLFSRWFDLAYFPNGKSTRTGESIVNILMLLWDPESANPRSVSGCGQLRLREGPQKDPKEGNHSGRSWIL